MKSGVEHIVLHAFLLFRAVFLLNKTRPGALLS
jgi:hypothetical protein